jgi:hypothetical protein
MSFYARQERHTVKPQVKFDNIFYKSETKFLDIHITKYMKWDPHITSLCYKLSQFFYMVVRAHML